VTRQPGNARPFASLNLPQPYYELVPTDAGFAHQPSLAHRVSGASYGWLRRWRRSSSRCTFLTGVPSAKIAFAKEGAKITQLTVADPNVMLTARRE